MLRSAYFTVTPAEPASAAETALKLEASAPKIAVAIRPRRPMEKVEAFMVISWMVDEWICPMAVVFGRRSTSAPCGSPSWVIKHRGNAMPSKAAVHETGPKVGERG